MLNFVYAIVDDREKNKPPEENSAYVGLTNNPNIRFQTHLQGNDGNGIKNDWLQGLLLVKPVPIKMKILEIIDGDRKLAQAQEKYWIHEYQRQGIRLTNKRLLLKPQNKHMPVTQYAIDDDLPDFEDEWLLLIQIERRSQKNVKLAFLLDCWYMAHIAARMDSREVDTFISWYNRTRENLHAYTYLLEDTQSSDFHLLQPYQEAFSSQQR